jgi:hypothetical protein
MRQVAYTLTFACLLVSSLHAQTPPVVPPGSPATAWQESVAPAGPASPRASLPSPIPWRQNVFSIPIQVTQPAGSPDSPSEVQLYTSTDRGQSWQLAKRVAPQAGKFTFRATSDGEYWFGMRTLKPNGLFFDNRPLTPGLRVLVDTIAPTLELRGNRGTAGEVELHWQIADAALDARTLKLEYQSAHDATWRPLSIGSMQPGQLPGSAVGSASFWNGQGVGVVSIRAEVSDIAGNRTVTQTKIALDEVPANAVAAEAARRPDATPGVPTIQQSQGARQNPAQTQQALNGNQPNQTQNPFEQRPATASNGPTQTGSLPGWQNANSPSGGANSYGVNPNVFPPGQGSAGVPAGNAFAVAGSSTGGATEAADDIFLTKPPVAQAWPADRVAQVPLEQSGPLSAQGERFYAQRTPPTTGTANAGIQSAGDLNYPPQANSNSPYRTISQPRAEAGKPAASPTPLPFELPRGAKLRMINSSAFELQYDVSAVDPKSIAKVELWGTRDGGKSWSLFGEDLDRQSPVPAEVRGDGIYGFSIVVQSNSGKSSPTPQPGSQPEVWIGVDQVSPQGILLGADSGENDINIRWTSSDDYPAAKPVTLSYAATPNGPWTQITTAQAAQGAYTWQPARDVPELVFLQLSVLDEAGNLSRTVSPQNVALPHHRPQGRILDVRPIAPSDPSAARNGGSFK